MDNYMGSPVYFGTRMPGQLKAFWDKTRVLRREKALAAECCRGAIAVGAGTLWGVKKTTLKAIHDMMLVQGMIIVGDGLSGV